MKFKLSKLNFSPSLIYIILVYFAGILFFGIYRLVFLLFNFNFLNENSKPYLIKALFSKGLNFDIAISSYIIALPVLFFLFAYMIKKQSILFSKISFYYINLAFFLAFIIAAIDIPYYSYYNSRITRAIFNWTNDLSSMTKSVILNVEYIKYYLVLFIICISWWFSHRFIYRKIFKNKKEQYNTTNEGILKRIIISLFVLLLLFSGIRGNWFFKQGPLRVREAFFTEYAFINQLGLNPIFSFMEGFVEKRINYFKDKEAITKMQQYMHITQKFDSPIAREIIPDTITNNKPNIVIVLMESMSAYQVGSLGNKKHLTPNLDSISERSISFSNLYSAGIHTSHGIMAALYSFPALLNKRPMVSTYGSVGTFAGIPNVLKDKGYQTLFFQTTDANFDNMQSFLSRNGFDTIFSNNSYEGYKRANNWGVPDHILFEYGIKKINEIEHNKKPFFATFMTITTHDPFDIPEDITFIPTADSKVDKCYQYADWAIGEFMKGAAKQQWFGNTIFVFVADHGFNFDPLYDMPITYHHIPLIIYAPDIVKTPRKIEGFGLQLDVFPTIMDVAGLQYTNNTIGMSLLKEQRPFAYFCADNKIGCVNNEYFLVIRNNGKESLYKYKKGDINNYIENQAELVIKMKDYTYSMLQTAQWMLENNKYQLSLNKD